MLALTYHGPGRVSVDRKDDPTIEHPDDVVLRVTRTAICGSDLHLYHGLIADTRVGCVFGHEFMGEVVAKGKGVRTLALGDRVVVPFNVACGTCYFCERGLTASCDSTNPANGVVGGAFGFSHTTGGYDGGQAELVRVPFADVGPFKVPEGVEDEDALFLSDILPTGYQAAEMGDIQPGETVIIFGAGPVGLFTAKSAWLLGAGRVIVVDHLDYRLDMIRRFAAVETVNYAEVGASHIIPHLREMTNGRGPDVCIDAVGMEASGSFLHKILGATMMQSGAPTVIEWCIDTVRKGGRVSLIGVYGPPFNLVPIGTAMNKGLTLRMGQCSVRRYMPRLLEHIQAGRIEPKAIISHHFPLEQAPDAYSLFAKKKDDCVKCVLIPPTVH